jgi:H+/Cl- antiporter ClcA
MAQPVSGSNSCLSYLANSPKLLKRGAYLLFALAIISAIAGVLAITGNIVTHPIFSKIPLAAGITMLVLGAAIPIAIPLILRKILGVGYREAHDQLEKDKAAGKINEVQYSMKKISLLSSERSTRCYCF